MAFQTSLLNLKKWDKVLEIGTGCAYQTAVLVEMGYRVYSIERQKQLYISAQQNLNRLDYQSPILFLGDGFAGLPQFAPFNGILVTWCPQIPKELLKQLCVGGRMVIPVGEVTQKMIVIDRVTEEEFKVTEHGEFKVCSYVDGNRKIETQYR